MRTLRCVNAQTSQSLQTLGSSQSYSTLKLHIVRITKGIFKLQEAIEQALWLSHISIHVRTLAHNPLTLVHPFPEAEASGSNTFKTDRS